MIRLLGWLEETTAFSAAIIISIGREIKLVRLLYDFKIHPLRRGAVFLVGIEVSDDHLQHIFAGSEIGADSNPAAGNQPLKIGLIRSIESIVLSSKNQFRIVIQTH